MPLAGEGGATEEASPLAGQSTCRIVLISGFESFNVNLYKQVLPAGAGMVIQCHVCPCLICSTCILDAGNRYLDRLCNEDLKDCHLLRFRNWSMGILGSPVPHQLCLWVDQQCPHLKRALPLIVESLPAVDADEPN